MAFPRFLIEAKLNDTARLVYMLLLDRCRVSQRNADWQDETGRVFVIYPIAKLAAALHRSEMTVKTALSSLEKAGLLRRQRIGVGRPNRLYLLFPVVGILSVTGKENCLSQGKNSVYPEERKLSGSNNNKSNNQSSNKERELGRTAYGAYLILHVWAFRTFNVMDI